nr:N-acetylneuraminate synthase family protein [uncultured Methanoregula sp.]
MIIGNINTDEKVLVIAEIGNNHEGNIEVARQLIMEAARCGVDAVKFQTYLTDLFISKRDVDRYKRLTSFQLSFRQFQELSDLAHSVGLLFISTPLDLESAHFLNDIVDAFKIASGDITFVPLLEYCTKTGKPLILSTGASESEELDKAISIIETSGSGESRHQDLGILHCVSCYPVPPFQTNLGTIRYLSNRYPYTIGYSDHTIGIEASVLSVGCGAKIVEKHFTLDKSYSSFRDHQLSSDPKDMKELVERIRIASMIIGKEGKNIQPCEKENIPSLRRSIVAKENIAKGHKITLSDLMWIRPGIGLSPGKENELIGKKLVRDILAGDIITVPDVE